VSDLAVADETEIVLQPAKGAATNGNGNGAFVGNSNGHGNGHAAAPAAGHVITSLSQSVSHFQLDAPTCPNCGHVAVRNGACYKCLNCGESLGCS